MRLFSSPRRTQRVYVSRRALVVSMMLAIFQLPAHAHGKERPAEYSTFYRKSQINGLPIFHIEGRLKDSLTLLHLLRLPCSSRLVARLFSRLSARDYLTAPD